MIQTSKFPLICTVVEKELETKLRKLNNDDALLRFDGLRADCLTAIINHLCHSHFSAKIWFQIPRTLVIEDDIEDASVLTDQNAAFVRNSTPPADKKLVLTANDTADSSIDTLKTVPSMDATSICSLDGWLDEITPRLAVQYQGHVESMLKGLVKSVCPELVDLEAFILSIQSYLQQGEQIQTAVNYSFPKIGLPRSCNEINKFFRNKRPDYRVWIRYFNKTCADRYDLFSSKARPSNLLNDELKENLEKLVAKDDSFRNTPAYNAYKSVADDAYEKSFIDLLCYEWEGDYLREFLTGVKAVQSKGIGALTRQFFQNERNDLLMESPSRLNIELSEFLDELDSFEKSKSKEIPPIFNEFYYQYFDELKASKEAPQLIKNWDKLLHNEKILTDDFLSGLMIAASRLVRQEQVSQLSDYKIQITVRKTFKSLTESMNSSALAYFRVMYKGLADYDDIFQWHFTRTQTKYNPLYQANPNSDKSENSTDSVAKDALSLQFSIGLIQRNADSKTKALGDISLVWLFPKKHIVHSFAQDLEKLKDNERYLGQIIFANSNRTTNNKGAIGGVTLDNPASIGTNSKGALSYRLSPRTLFDLRKNFVDECATADLAQDHPLVISWNDFYKKYSLALKDLIEKGLVATSIDDAKNAYDKLLQDIEQLPDTSAIRKPFYSLIVSIGVYSFIDVSNSYAIVPPWNPLRLYALRCRFVSRANLIRQLMSGERISLAEKSVFFDHLVDPHPEYFDPQVVSMPMQRQLSSAENTFHADWQLLSPVQTGYGYSLYSLPCQDHNDKRQQIGTSGASIKSAKDAIATYLKLYPHEKDNFTIALPDVLSSEMPVKLAKALYDEYLKDDGNSDLAEAHFTLKVGRFTAQQPNCQLYEDLTGDATDTAELRDAALMSNSIGSSLRIQVETNPSSQIPSRNCNLALVDHLLSDNAELQWQTVDLQLYDPMDISSMPELQNRRYFDYKNPADAKTFIVTPLQTKVGADYLRSLTNTLKDRSQAELDLKSSKISLPALSLSTTIPSLGNNLSQVHAMADWVLICNDLIDKRQLLDRQIEVVRYKTDRKNNRTEIISSKLPVDILGTHLRTVLDPVQPYHSNLDLIIKGLITSSYEISGFLALRAARQDRNARELAGVTLSRYLTQKHILSLLKQANEEPLIIATYLIDDYCSWFELLDLTSLADLLMLSVSRDETGKICLHIYITEAKFVSDSIRMDEAKKSAQQLKRTVEHVVDTFKRTSSRTYDRKIWLNRIADLIQDSPKEFHIESSVAIGEATRTIEEVTKAIRNDNISLTVDGLSHVFSYDWENKDADIRDALDPQLRCYQDIYGSSSIRKILTAFEKNADLNLNLCPQISRFTTIGTVVATDTSISTETSAPVIVSSADLSQEPRQVIDTTVTAVVETEKEQSVSQQEIMENEPHNEVTFEPVQDNTQENNPMQQRYAPGFEALINAKAEDNGYSALRQQWADQASRSLQMKLQQKNIRAVEIDHILTPNGCLVRYEGDDSLNSKVITSLKENLLTTASLEVIFANAAPGEFQILLKCPVRESISMWSIWKKRQVQRNKAGINLNFAIGLKEIDNQILFLNPIEQDPHTLVAGGTGSGKTVLVQMLLLDIAATNPSYKMQFYLIDPKRSVDYTAFKRLPHLAAPQIRDKDEAEQLLQQLVEEMHHRLDLFESVGAKNLERYNAKVSKEQQLPVLWLIHDEFAAWMIDKHYAAQIEKTLTVLTVQARATGIYLVLIAQRPDKDVMPMQIRDNLGNRLALKLPTEQSSVIALGDKGAEVLLGKGHLAAKLNNHIVYAQVPYLDEDSDEIEEAIDAIIKYDSQWD